VTTEAIRKAAARLVDRIDVGPAPVDTARVAQTLGLVVAHERLLVEITGALVTTPAGPAACLNSAQPAKRQRLALAHMIGHVQLGHRFPGRVHVEGRFEAYRDDRRYTPAERMEFEANVFAGSLLMPVRLLRASVSRLTSGRLTDDDILQLAADYGVSVQGMTLRLVSSGLL
jgi:Zn-dependent peptidase ImmA (M78 family)